jgi:HEAT repeat protein
MPKTLQELTSQLSAIEPDLSTYDGIDPSDIPLLSQLLQDPETWMACRAVFALSRISDRSAVALLSKAAADPRKEIRVALAASTKNMDPRDANSILMTLLTDAEVGVRKFAVGSVSRSHDPAVLTKLKDLQIRDPVPRIRDFAEDKLRALGLIGPP